MLDQLTPLAIRAFVGDKVFARGEQYARSGAVQHLRRLGDTLHAAVSGHDYAPYLVRIRLSEGRIRAARCTCPYSDTYGGPCKHIAAVLLVARKRRPSSEPSLDARLTDLDAPALRLLIHRLLDAAPDLLEALDTLLDPDEAAFLEDDEAAWITPEDTDELPALQIPALLEAGRHDEALQLLEAYPDELLALTAAEAVAETHPAWVAEHAPRFVHTHVGAGRSDRYDDAARWLIALRRACLAHDNPAGWRETLSDVRTRYGRKWGFIQALEARLEEAHAAE